MGLQNLMESGGSEEESSRNPKKGSSWFLYFCSFTADLLLISYGFALSWPSSVIPKLKSSDPNVNPFTTPVSTIQISTLAALPTIAACVGLYLSPQLSDIVGRKKSMCVLSTILISSFSILSFVKNINVYYICVFVNGFCESSLFAAAMVYQTELAQDSNRGRINCLSGVSVPIGSLIAYSLSDFNITPICLTGATLPTTFLLLSIFIPESPIYLVSKGRDKECILALETLRNNNDVDTEYEAIKETVAKDDKKIGSSNITHIFRSKNSCKAFLISIEILLIVEASGIYILQVFMIPIFNEAGGYLSGHIIGVIAGVVQVFIAVIAALIVDKLGRRPLLLTSSISCILNLFCLGVYFFLLKIESTAIINLKWFPIFIVILYYIGYGVGLGPIPVPLMGELFPNDLRSIGMGLVFIISNLTISGILFGFPIIKESYGMHFCMWGSCFLSILGLFGIYFTVPETKGKSFAEIKRLLSGNKN